MDLEAQKQNYKDDYIDDMEKEMDEVGNRTINVSTKKKVGKVLGGMRLSKGMKVSDNGYIYMANDSKLQQHDSSEESVDKIIEGYLDKK